MENENQKHPDKYILIDNVAIFMDEAGTINDVYSSKTIYKRRSNHVPSFTRLVFILFYAFAVSYIVLSTINILKQPFDENCFASLDCKFTLVETIPENITFAPGEVIHMSTFEAWEILLEAAKNDIDLGEFYFSLKNEDVTPIKMKSAWQGEKILADLIAAGQFRNISIRIAHNSPSNEIQQNDIKILEKEAGANIRSVNFEKLFGAGVLHTKMWIVDKKHVYIGSANMDWQSLTQVKELGLLIQDCPCVAQDISKIFEVYWYLGLNNSVIPPTWPSDWVTTFNIENPFAIKINDAPNDVFVASSPLALNPEGRTNDIDALLAVIRSAEKFIDIAVMDYFPRLLYTKGMKYWPVIDGELRRVAVEKKIRIRLLASHWNHSRPDLVRWLDSLQSLSESGYPSIDIQTKLFVVPAYTEDQKSLEYGRVNHNKYMVTDKTAYIGTSNWSGDYFINTAGVSVSITPRKSEGNGTSIRSQLASVFNRDWNSQYARNISEFL